MATYYKYAERDASNQVNWSEITSNMVNSLKEVEAIRESKRKAINDATTELSTTLSEAPQGDHRGLNEFAMTYANNAQQMRLMQDQLLKSGQLKLRDYNIGRANLTQGTTQLFNLGKKYQSIYSDRMEKFKSGATGELDAAMLSRLEGFANFSNHEAYINPTNGLVSMGKLIDKDVAGKTVRTMDRTPGSFTTIQQLNFSLSQEIPKYQLDNLDAEVAKFADTYLTTNGAYSSLDDVREMPEFDQIVNDMVSSQLVVENSVGSILASYIGGYEIVFNKEEQNENSILMIEDPRQPGSGKMIMDVESEMGKKQKTKAEEFLRRHIDKQLGRKETETEPSTSSKNEAKERNQQIGVRDLWNDMYTEPTIKGKNKIASAMLSSPYLLGGKNPVTDINFLEINTGTETDPVMELAMEVEYLDQSQNRSGENAIIIGEGNPTIKDWAMIGVEIHGLDKESEFMGKLNKDSKWGGPMSGVSARRGSNKQSSSTIVRNQVRAMLGNKKNVFENKADHEVATFLQSKLGSLGFTFRADNTAFNDVMVKYPGGGDDEYTFEVGNRGSAKKTKDFLDFIIPLITNEAADAFVETGMNISGEVFGKSKVTENKKEDDKKKLPGT